ncbi:uncharacterized protein [Penaeus vannamei]|uniref:uncharacterized protein n=1 Tax=Penaeus vannamei TaxID=6689 RepID=UPI000F668BF3|nr:uncharacterized protein LOC113825256 [Penaeus vannamei]
MSKKRTIKEATEASTSADPEPKGEEKRQKTGPGDAEVASAAKTLRELAAELQPVSERLAALATRYYEAGPRLRGVARLCERVFAETALWAERAKRTYRTVQGARGRETKDQLLEDEGDVADKKRALSALASKQPLTEGEGAALRSAFRRIVSRMDKNLRKTGVKEWITDPVTQITQEELGLVEFNRIFVSNQSEILEELAKDLLTDPDPTLHIPLPYTKYFSSDFRPRNSPHARQKSQAGRRQQM